MTELRLEDASGETPDESGLRWYVRARDTGAVLAIDSPHPEGDCDDDGSRYVRYVFDSLAIFDEGEWRDLTDDEQDEYADDVRAYIRASSDVFL